MGSAGSVSGGIQSGRGMELPTSLLSNTNQQNAQFSKLIANLEFLLKKKIENKY
jgi:hypothetical protein